MSRDTTLRQDLEYESESSNAVAPTAFLHAEYTIGWICALPLELSAAKAMLNVVHVSLRNPRHDQNTYTLGKVGDHNVVIACMSSGVYGMTSATRVASQMSSTFPSIRFTLLVGVGGGAPTVHADIRLGDVVVSHPTANFGGVVQYDYGKTIQEGAFHRTGILNKPPEALLTAISSLQADHRMRSNRILEYLGGLAIKHPLMAPEFSHPPQQSDQLFDSGYEHVDPETTCDECDPSRLVIRVARPGHCPVVHYGLIASANQVMKHAATRDRLAYELGVLCFEMEAGGLMDNFPCLVIRGVCDYADTHKNKAWQAFAAATAAAYAKELLSFVSVHQDGMATMTGSSLNLSIEGQRFMGAASQTNHNSPFVLPFRQDPDFMNRPVLEQILSRASGPGARVGLVGLGGVGKSQIVIEYAYRVRAIQPNTSVFWIHASSATRFEESFREIAIHLQLPACRDSNVDILSIVYSWLVDERHGRWTIVLDNADDADILFQSSTQQSANAAITSDRSLADFLPFTTNGSIVITSRNQDVVRRLQVHSDDTLDILPMEVDIAEALLLKKLKKGSRPSTDDARRLVIHLDCMPLAISQAAAYIDHGAPRTSVSRYTDMLESSDKDCAKLLQKDIRDPRRDRDASNSIVKTWHMTFKHLRREHNSAAQLLALMSVFDREAIPANFIQDSYIEDPDSEADFEDDIAILREYNLIGIKMNGDHFNMHRLVQLSTQKWLEINTELAHWQERCIDILNSVSVREEYGNWETWQTIFPHVQIMQTYRVASVPHRQQWAATLYEASLYALQMGRYSAAEEIIRASLGVCQELLGPDDTATLNCMEILAAVLENMGNYAQAEEIHRQTLTQNTRVLGPDHLNTLGSLDNLALVLMDRGQYVEAEQMHRQALAGREKIFGVGHLDTLKSVNNLARLLHIKSEFAEAERMYRQVAAKQENVFGVDHPYTLLSLNNLAALMMDQGKLFEAEKMHRQVVAGMEKVFGVEHPSTLTSMSNLARVLHSRGSYLEAERLQVKVLEIRVRMLGPDHPDTLISINNLAVLRTSQGRFCEAEKMHRQVLAILEKVLGPDHPYTLDSFYCLAQVLDRMQRYDEALSLYDRAIDGHNSILGPDHRRTSACRNSRTQLLERGKSNNQSHPDSQRSEDLNVPFVQPSVQHNRRDSMEGSVKDAQMVVDS